MTNATTKFKAFMEKLKSRPPSFWPAEKRRSSMDRSRTRSVRAARLDLNCEKIEVIGEPDPAQMPDLQVAVSDPSTSSVFFRGIKEKLIAQIEEADYVFGCVAWLTDFEVLAALAKKRGVCIVVQKEDFLRPDGPGQGDQWRRRLRAAYDALPTLGSRWSFGRGLIAKLSVFSGNEPVSAVRCAGYDRRVGNGRFTPLMHHKFALFARFSLYGPHDPRIPERDPELGGYFTNDELMIFFSMDYRGQTRRGRAATTGARTLRIRSRTRSCSESPQPSTLTFGSFSRSWPCPSLLIGRASTSNLSGASERKKRS